MSCPECSDLPKRPLEGLHNVESTSTIINLFKYLVSKNPPEASQVVVVNIKVEKTYQGNLLVWNDIRIKAGAFLPHSIQPNFLYQKLIFWLLYNSSQEKLRPFEERRMLCQEKTKINKDFVKPGPGDDEVKLSARKHSAFLLNWSDISSKNNLRSRIGRWEINLRNLLHLRCAQTWVEN